ncbi:hypothetical protein BJ138DRAFT_1066164 [Hygrophoropsis aurantiaca]|uniref:Uncharacterized protein n=1 Tax=Hygrophoropsis aurantiaca TaxID=72124 RepID=A0ACB8A9L3_9AGAM|nr:hypothetical protein BJ138DRAFT_1066164 [Hygrophoropsis aurantiaca]
MTEDIDVGSPKTGSSPSPEPSASPNLVPRKRKAHPDGGNLQDGSGDSGNGPEIAVKGEYETGRVICEVCGEGVSFRDDNSGGFTLKHWDAHRQQCANTTQAVPEPVVYTPESTAEALANPPAKRRRAKRTEEERIDYLRADPYVAQFEAYRVLCASCDKWIRLRPNSTYCSIPWDAHRKSCLSKKINSKNVYALEERNSLFTKDPDIRKFDAERVLCNVCDRWIAISPDNHMQAVQKWLHHRTSCQKTNGASTSSVGHEEGPSTLSLTVSGDVPPSGQQPEAGTSGVHNDQESDTLAGPSVNIKAVAPRSVQSDSPSSSFKDLTPTSFPPAHESRRRNAEQRAATLRADPFVAEVEPNRVFCSLCKKWVQLRQDSSYCAYPWLQHRGKCLARHERRAQKAAGTTEMRTNRGAVTGYDDALTDEDASAEDELDSDEGPNHRGEDRLSRSEEKRKAKVPAMSEMRPLSHSAKKHRLDVGDARLGPSWMGSDIPGPAKKLLHASRPIRPKGKGDPENSFSMDPPSSSNRFARRLSLNFADLDSPLGRMDFIFSSITYLFMTTYETSDDMTISALLTYLNAAMPVDKHEDFDTAEVVKAAAALQDRGDIVFEGDMLRLSD